MKRPLAGLRLGVILLFLLGFLSPMASIGAGAQDLTCDDFNSERAAQAVLDADPEMEDALDPDGNGVACDHEEVAADDEEDAATDEEDAATDEEDDGSSDDDAASGDGEAYLADVQDELDTLAEQFDRFLEIDAIIGDATDAEAQELITEINDLAAGWVEYPDVAAEFVAPAGYEDVEESYLDFADTVGETGELWEEYWAIPADDDEAEEIAFEAFNESFISAQDQLDEVQSLVDELGGGSSSDDATDDDQDSTDDATEEADDTADETDGSDDATGGDDEYLTTVQDELDTLVDESDRVVEILELAEAGDATSAEVEEINDIFVSWAEYPDVAAELEAPSEYADIEDAYLDLADSVGETGEAWEVYWGLEAGDPDEEDALADFEGSFGATLDLIDEVQGLVDDAGGSGGSDDATDETDATDDSTDEADDATDETDDSGDATDGGDAEGYLSEVTEQSEEWNDSITRFNEILQAGEFTDAEITEISEIVTVWLGAPDIASGADVPAGMEGVQEAYEAYADALAEAGTNFTVWLSSESGTAESTEALDAFTASIADSQDAYAVLQDELAAAG
jgi:hypothetical protein